MREVKIQRQHSYHGHAVNFFIDQIKLPNGKRAQREYLDHPGAVAAIACVHPNKIILVRQYRYPVGQETYEIPAGKLAHREKPRQCIKRELQEETGYRTGRLRHLLSYWPTPAFSNEVIHIYLASNLKPGAQKLDEDEFLTVHQVSLSQALNWIKQGKIRDSKTVIALLALKMYIIKP